MDNLETRIMASLEGRQGIFFAEDAHLPGATLQATRFALAALSKEGQIVRLARGVYCKPPLEAYSKKRILPSPFEIAQAIARRGDLLLVPDGATAAARCGLTQGTPNELTFLSTGCTRRIGLTNGKAIRLIHSAETKKFNFGSDRMRDLSNGLRWIGEARLGEPEVEAARLWLKGISEEEYEGDAGRCPEWVKTLMGELRRENEERGNR